jgi:hypothetical protein
MLIRLSYLEILTGSKSPPSIWNIPTESGSITAGLNDETMASTESTMAEQAIQHKISISILLPTKAIGMPGQWWFKGFKCICQSGTHNIFLTANIAHIFMTTSITANITHVKSDDAATITHIKSDDGSKHYSCQT